MSSLAAEFARSRHGSRATMLRLRRRLGLPSTRERLEAAALVGDRDALVELAKRRPMRVAYKIGGNPPDHLSQARSARVTAYVAGRHVATYDGEAVLRAWARWCAWQVRDLWEPPEVVVRWLRYGREEDRDTASNVAAWAAANAANVAWSARSAAWSAWRSPAVWAASHAAALAGGASRGAVWDVQQRQLRRMLTEGLAGRREWGWGDNE